MMIERSKKKLERDASSSPLKVRWALNQKSRFGFSRRSSENSGKRSVALQMMDRWRLN
jgi:hypothetical protein